MGKARARLLQPIRLRVERDLKWAKREGRTELRASGLTVTLPGSFVVFIICHTSSYNIDADISQIYGDCQLEVMR
jgi:hypothetical protein